MAKILALIPARAGSKSIPKKNIKLLNGHPLMAYSIAVAKLSKLINRLIVSTDSQEFANIALKYGAEVPFLRPVEISQDNSLDIEFFQHALDWLKTKENYLPDYVVHLRPTAPLRDYRVVDRAIKIFIEDKEATSLRSVQPIHLTPYKLFKVENGYLEPFMTDRKEPDFHNFPRQIFPQTYFPNCYVDIIRSKYLLKTGVLHGDHIKAFLTNQAVDIDNVEDFQLAERMLEERKFKALGDYLANFQ